MTGNSLRDEMKDCIRDLLISRLNEYLTESEINELVYDLADEVFGVLDTSDHEQDQPYEESLPTSRWKAIPVGWPDGNQGR
jgi:hypothetical protein